MWLIFGGVKVGWRWGEGGVGCTMSNGARSYQQERMAFFSRHLCRVKPMPDILISSLQALHTDRTVNHIMDAWLLSDLTIVV